MKITVRINEFKRVLQEARRVVPDSDNALPYLRYVKVDVDGENRATVTGSDLGSAIVQTFEVVDGDVGSFLLHAKQADNFLKRHVDGVATIEVAPEDKATVVKAGGFSTKIPGIDVCLFPQ